MVARVPGHALDLQGTIKLGKEFYSGNSSSKFTTSSEILLYCNHRNGVESKKKTSMIHIISEDTFWAHRMFPIYQTLVSKHSPPWPGDRRCRHSCPLLSSRSFEWTRRWHRPEERPLRRMEETSRGPEREMELVNSSSHSGLRHSNFGHFFTLLLPCQKLFYPLLIPSLAVSFSTIHIIPKLLVFHIYHIWANKRLI